MTTVRDAFKLARFQAAQHMTTCERADFRWSETSITEIVVAQVAQTVTVFPFTQRAEAASGADWIWWWVDGAGAYGMLVQAKRMTATKDGWKFDFGYRTRSAVNSQRQVLQSTAAALNLFPVYALYLGTGNYRQWERCSYAHTGEKCVSCIERTLSLMPALLADEIFVDNALSTYGRSVALENLWEPPSTSALLIPTLEKQIAPDLLNFLREPQHGSRAVTRSMIDRVLKVRAGQLSAVTRDTTTTSYENYDQLGSIFRTTPDDTGHWHEQYFKHTMNPLLHAPPHYVLDVISGDFDEKDIKSSMPSNIAGVVVVQVSQRGQVSAGSETSE